MKWHEPVFGLLKNNENPGSAGMWVVAVNKKMRWQVELANY